MRVFNQEDVREAKNSPNIIRRSFLNYLRTEFPYGESWIHPVNNNKIEHALIKRVLTDYMKMDCLGYKALWYLWTTQGTRSFIAEQLNFSAPTVKRKWDKSINTIMHMLLFPELTPSHFVLFNSQFN
jgi:hypothetical protein